MRQNYTELQELRQQLQLYRFFTRDEQLRQELKEWIEESRSREAGSLHEYQRRQLTELKSEYPMRWVPSLNTGEEAFPDKCESCEHYGKACPVLADRERRLSRERRLQEAEGSRESREIWEDIALETGCKLIPQWLEEWREEQQEFINRGNRLLERLQDMMQDASSDRERIPSEFQESVDAGDVMAFGGSHD